MSSGCHFWHLKTQAFTCKGDTVAVLPLLQLSLDNVPDGLSDLMWQNSATNTAFSSRAFHVSPTETLSPI